ncbi:Sec-independent protein translocase subunit TatA/TatB [Gaoshiqia sediminis]|uniref:Twin-arginine translocase TatA/TatE family subunit n=1 Tax=Gaoshiqia sediminis TaxID=2986998 RepID=A0AA41YD69_9BACT|nr:twin-arginine translocase TatA/TatE family subunit [Gaoshiqia sediminis]MCW0484435.1 twin-arginine translocase TatA/TatE family subunit [Gaoshiqia sediminis]
MAQTLLFISGGEIVMVMLIALLFFGSKSIPDIARTLGKGVREFKKATNEIKRELNENTGEFKKDIDNISSSVKESTHKLTKDINDGLSE